MFRLASGALYEGRLKSIVVNALKSAGAVLLLAAGTGVAVAGVGVAAGRTLFAVGVLLPKPINVHQRNMIATRPRPAAQISFFFSPGLLRSTNCISIIRYQRYAGSTSPYSTEDSRVSHECPMMVRRSPQPTSARYSAARAVVPPG